MSDKKKIKEADEGRVTTKASVLTDELMDKATGGNKHKKKKKKKNTLE